jgi:hypothetical protein
VRTLYFFLSCNHEQKPDIAASLTEPLIGASTVLSAVSTKHLSSSLSAASTRSSSTKDILAVNHILNAECSDRIRPLDLQLSLQAGCYDDGVS